MTPEKIIITAGKQPELPVGIVRLLSCSVNLRGFPKVARLEFVRCADGKSFTDVEEWYLQKISSFDPLSIVLVNYPPPEGKRYTIVNTMKDCRA